MTCASVLRLHFRLPSRLAVRLLAVAAMLAAVAIAAEPPPIGLSAGLDGGACVRVKLEPQPPMHLAEGFEVRLADGTVLEAETVPEPDLPGESRRTRKRWRSRMACRKERSPRRPCS